jgi:hypothetical protein
MMIVNVVRFYKGNGQNLLKKKNRNAKEIVERNPC